jgi:hypothetical protein
MYSLSAFAIGRYLVRHVYACSGKVHIRLYSDPLHCQDAHIEPGQIQGRAY